MPINKKISATTEAVEPGSATEFTVAGPFWMFADGFKSDENGWVERANVAGDGWEPVTNNRGKVAVSENPNTVYVDVPAGTYRFGKTKSRAAVSMGYEVA